MEQKKTEIVNPAVAKVASDVQQGVPPSSENLIEFLNEAKQVIEQQQQSTSLPHYGSRIVADVQQVIGDTQKFLEEKNKGDHLQKIITGVQLASTDPALQGKAQQLYQEASGTSMKQAVGVSPEEMQQTMDYMKSVVLQLIQSPEFRQLMLDFIELLKSSFVLSVKQHRKDPLTSTLEKDVKVGQPRPLSHTLQDTQKELESSAKKTVEKIQQGKLEEALPVPLDKAQQHQLESDWRTFLKKLSANRDYHRAANGLLSIIDQFQVHLVPYLQQLSSSTTTSTVTSSPALLLVWQESANLLAEFAGKEPVTEFKESFMKLFQSFSQDPGLKAYLNKLRTYLKEILQEPTHLDSDNYQQQARDILNEGRELSSKWKKRRTLKKFSRKSEKLINSIRHDPLSNKFSVDTKRLGEHLLLDEQGRPSLAVTQQAIQGISALLFPMISQLLKSLPLPTIQGSNETYDWSLDHLLLLSPQALLPEQFELYFRSKMNVTTPTPTTAAAPHRLEAATLRSQAEVVLRLRGFEIFFKDLHFYFKRKEFPKVEDTGIANVTLTGSSNFLQIIWTLDDSGLSLMDVRVVFDELDFQIKQAEHDILLPLFTKMFKGTIKRKLENFVEESMTTAVDKLNIQLNQAITKAQKTTSETLSNVLESKIAPVIAPSSTSVISSEKSSF